MKHDVAAFERAAREAVHWIAEYLADPGRYRITPEMQPGGLMDRLPPSGPVQGERLEAIFADFERQILPAVTHWNHPRFFNYFACTGSVPAVVAEMLAAALNTNGLNWVASPAVAELEQVALGWLREWMGLSPDYFGQILDTASISTLHAVMAAREVADPGVRRYGITRPLMVYASDQVHSSIDKAVIAAGLGLGNLRKIPSDAAFQMRPEALAAAMAADQAAGRTPCCVVATIGTTSTTSVDPLADVVEIAARYKAWVHVDAAYAGAAAILPEYRGILSGLERADSYVMNPHKWLFTPVDASAFYTRHPEILRRTFTVTPEYLATTDDPREVNLMDYGVALGRRFRGLKLWYVLRYYGLEGLQSLLRGHIAMARELARWIEGEPGFVLAAPAPFSTVCFRLEQGDDATRDLVDQLNDSGEFFISKTILRGVFCGRIAIGNQATEPADVAALWAAMRRIANRDS